MLTNYKPKRVNGVSIEIAYHELTPPAFAVWMRLHVVDDTDLIGRKTVAKVVEYSEGRSNDILRELNLKGYVTSIPGPGPAFPTRFELKRRAVLKGNNQFVSLSHMMALQDNTKTQRIANNVQSGVVEMIQPVMADTVHNAQHLLNKRNDTKRSKITTLPDSIAKLLDKSHTNELDTSDEQVTKSPIVAVKRVKQLSIPSAFTQSTGNSPKSLSDSKSVEKHETQTPTHLPQIPNQTKSHKTEIVDQKPQESKELEGASLSRLDMNKFLLKKKERRERKGMGFKGKGKSNNKQASGDWTKDARHKPTITFTPGHKERERMIDIMEKRKSDPERKAMVAKIGSEFLRIYSRYRRTIDISYHTIDKEKRHAETAGILCIYRSITPTQLIAFWAEHVGDFTGLKFPPLTFLMSPGNVDRAACEVVLNKGVQNRKSTDGPRPEGNAYSNIGNLNNQLRPGLNKAGFDVAQYDDRYLMTVQCAAQAIAKGFDMFVSSKLRPMVQWAVENLYAN
jgi:hypothetical protein